MPAPEDRGAGESEDSRIKLVVLGCGFAGFSLLSRIDRDRFNPILISPRNYFLFTPLLPSAATGTVELRSILEPARRRLSGVRLIEAQAVRVDWREHEVHCRAEVEEETFPVHYDRLVVAVGSRTADYGVEGVAEHALPLASIEDARRIRVAVLRQLAMADLPGLANEEIQERLTF
ncbi:MAG TPA: FAD-dependent oxidoreductase, partial [Thermoanaerobaculia bacterium]|nr:FAD-dependent oxidoreductase [Thermoanaerobaculia bacterium]